MLVVFSFFLVCVLCVLSVWLAGWLCVCALSLVVFFFFFFFCGAGVVVAAAAAVLCCVVVAVCRGCVVLQAGLQANPPLSGTRHKDAGRGSTRTESGATRWRSQRRMASHNEDLRDPLDGRHVNDAAAAADDDDDDDDDGLGAAVMGPPSTPLRSVATFHTAYTPTTPGTAASALSTPTTAGLDSRARSLFLGGGAASNGSSPGSSPSRAERRRRRKMAAYHRWEAKYGFRIIAYVNTKSGGKQGQQVLEKLRTRLPPHQVHDLFQPFEGVEHTLPKHMADADNERFERDVERVKTLRILACGGDGTVGWVASSMEKLDLEYMPEVALLPLGTGNDLAKVLRWQRYFNKIETFHVKHFIKKVFTARSSRLDRWKLRVLTADVLDRDQLHMFVPPSLRRTHSLVGGSEAHNQLDHELMKVQLAKRQSLYRRNLAAAQRVAAQWFEDRELFEKQQQVCMFVKNGNETRVRDSTELMITRRSHAVCHLQVSGGVTDFRKWQEAHHASKRNNGGDANADVEVEVVDALSAKNRVFRAAAAADPRDMVKCNIGGLPVAIDHREKKLFTAEEILAKARNNVATDPTDSKRLRQIADASLAGGKEDYSDEEDPGTAANPTNGRGAKVGTGNYRRRKKRSPRPLTSAATVSTSDTVDKAKPVTYNRAESISSTMSSAASSPQKGGMSPDSRVRASNSDLVPPGLPKVTEDSAPEMSALGDEQTEQSEQPIDNGHDSFSSGEDSTTSGPTPTNEVTNNSAVQTRGTVPFPERVATPTRVSLDAAIENRGQRTSARVRFAPTLSNLRTGKSTDEAKTSERLERRILGSPTHGGDSVVSPTDTLVFTRTLTPAPRVSFSFGKERAHFSGAGIVLANDGAITDDEEYDPEYQLRREQEEAQKSEHEEEAATPPGFISSSKDRGVSGGGAAKPSLARSKEVPTRRQTLEMQASHFRPWKTGTLLNYFHVRVHSFAQRMLRPCQRISFDVAHIFV